MKKSILKHILFIMVLAIIIIAYLLCIFYIQFSYAFVFGGGYLFLIVYLINTFYIKKKSGMCFKILTWIGSLLNFIPLPFLVTGFVSNAQGIFLVVCCTVLFFLNSAYMLFLILQKNRNVSLPCYTIFLSVIILLLSLEFAYLCRLICLSPT